MSSNVLKLYITGRTRRSREAVRNLRSLLATRLSPGYDLSVVDVLENPEEAEADRILATPTLLRRGAYGATRIIGDLSDSERVIALLGDEGASENRAGEANDR
jgi:circadian clock protein KaiB